MNRYAKTFAVGAVGLAGAIAIGVGSAGASSFNYPPCAAGQNPTPQVPCIPAGFTPPGGTGTGAVPPGTGGVPPGASIPGGGTTPGAGGQGFPTNLPQCAPGTRPSPGNPCLLDQTLPECGPAGPPKLNPDGTLPDGAVACKPSGAVQFNQAPPKEATNKLMTLDVDVDGEGEKAGDFDVTLNKIVKGIGKAARAKLQDQLEGESFIIGTNGGTKCFADKKSDPDAEADKVSCKMLTDAVDDSAVTIKATIQARMKFDSASFTPTFTATKVVIKGKSKI